MHVKVTQADLLYCNTVGLYDVNMRSAEISTLESLFIELVVKGFNLIGGKSLLKLGP
jgi:hypothetical protein